MTRTIHAELLKLCRTRVLVATALSTVVLTVAATLIIVTTADAGGGPAGASVAARGS